MSEVTLSTGATIWYRKQGSGPPMIQIHGSAFGHRNFEKLTPLVARDFEVIEFDLPGFGDSHGGPVNQTMDDIAAQVAEFVLALGYSTVKVHGTSFGAMIALTLAARHPEVVDSLVLSCFLARYDSAARIMRATWKRASLDSGMEAVADLTSVAGFARSFYDTAGAQEQLTAMRVAFSKTDAQAFIAATEAIEAADLSPLVGQVAARALLIAGAEDNMTPFAPAASGVGMAAIAQQLIGSETHVLPECGHYLVIERPVEAAALIKKFLAPVT